MKIPFAATVLALLAALAGVSCGGSSSGDPPAGAEPSDAEREAATRQTAQDHPACTAIQPFHWQVGDRDGRLAAGQSGSAAPDGDTSLSIASASKWLYAGYVVQRQGGVRDADVPFLNFTSGYSGFDLPVCLPKGTVADCLAGGRGERDATEAREALFHYNSGHMQNHADLLGLGHLVNASLATELRSQLGTGIALAFSEPQLAGGVEMSADQYAQFLRQMLVGHPDALRIGAALGSHPVCTLPGRCATAVDSPVPEAWHYSLGHWVEDDPASTPAGDGAFSSPGAFGFYPWIDATRSVYGVISRQQISLRHEGYESARCGRLLRAAWLSGQPQ